MEQEPSLSKSINAVDVLAILPMREPGGIEDVLESYRERCAGIMARDEVLVTVRRKDKTRTVNLKDVLLDLRVERSDLLASVAEIPSGKPAAMLRLRAGDGASLRPAEVVSELFGETLCPIDFVRVHCWHIDSEGRTRDPLESPSAWNSSKRRSADGATPALR
jgi:hypothetical protein